MAKKRAVDGVMLLAQAVKGHPLAPGRVGLVKLSVHKDRPGRVREHAGTGDLFAEFVLDSTSASPVGCSPCCACPGVSFGGRWHPVHVGTWRRFLCGCPRRTALCLRQRSRLALGVRLSLSARLWTRWSLRVLWRRFRRVLIVVPVCEAVLAGC